MGWDKAYGDRRKEPRYDIFVYVKVISLGTSFVAVAKNISGGGMEIQLQKNINPHTKITIVMKLHEEIIFQGTVVWSLGDYSNNQWIYRVGIETDSISCQNETKSTPEEKRKLIHAMLPQMGDTKPDKTLTNQMVI